MDFVNWTEARSEVGKKILQAYFVMGLLVYLSCKTSRMINWNIEFKIKINRAGLTARR
jgi:hypothetical protein